MKISVIIPVYNVEKFIARCLDSIIDQSLQDIEVIMVDDCGTDNSVQIANEYVLKDKRFFLIHNERNMGLMWTRRAGYLMAKGDYIVFCDSDDYLLPDALRLLYDAIVTASADIVASSYVRHTFKGKDVVVQNKLSCGGDKTSVYKSLLTEKLSHSLWAKIFSAHLFRNYSYETKAHQTNSEDGLLFYQIVENIKKMEVLNEPTYCYIFNPSSSTMANANHKLPQIMFFQHWKFSYLKSKDGLFDILVKTTIMKRANLLKYKISISELFVEDELRDNLSLKKLFALFPFLKALKLYLKIHFPFVSYLSRIKYFMQIWVLKNI